MEITGPRDSLAQLDAIRHLTRQRLSAFWVPLALFGPAMLVVGVLGVAYGETVLGYGQFLSCVVGTIVITVFYRRRGTRLGLRKHQWPYLATAVAITAACAVTGSVVRARPVDAAPLLLVAAGYLVFAWLERSVHLFALALSFVAAVVAVLREFPTAPPGALTMACGGLCLVGGVAIRWKTGR